MKWTLHLSFGNQMGESYNMALDVDEHIARQISRLQPLPKGDIEVSLSGVTFADACEVLKTKQFRKDLFIAETKRLGALLAERMEDAEGWHDENRIEPARNQLRGKYGHD